MYLRKTLRRFTFQLHWFFGITAGVILMIVGVTGGLLSFEREILALINPGVMRVSPVAGMEKLSPEAQLEKIQERAPGRRINGLTFHADPRNAHQVSLASTDPAMRRGETLFVDPYTGAFPGDVRGESFFRTVQHLHRWLLTNELFGDRNIGKQIVGASTVLLMVLCISGLYLRWPRKVFSLKRWLTFRVKQKGRKFLWNSHAVLGTWALLFFLLASVTGLYWSYNWYREMLHSVSGVPMPVRMAPAPSPAENTQTTAGAERRRGEGRGERSRSPGEGAGQAGEVQEVMTEKGLNELWALFLQESGGDYSQAMVRFPQNPGQALMVMYQDAKPSHERAFNRMEIDPVTGAVLNHDRYRDRPLNVRLMSSMLPLHSGSYFGLPGKVLMFLASIGMPFFSITGWMLYLDRRKRRKRKEESAEVFGIQTPGTHHG
ncbi:PepSY domain-containing protein [Desulfobotulus sp. H1]|uniref:PepSY domain-containing protein n=1 Tax=Desulfobotulus pelophilus TaxID=2823377 RepID=A0ABT3N9A9_9BACT|nr:PepSY-associated TM helix domain-containing protein [Desulfobotulus pelophilus]MCW7754041.1 PepSY domain-containing protein [Desulfobotulus pelophilus]